MLIAYDSRTGNVKRFIERTHLPAVQINEDLVLQEPFILVTYTTGIGALPTRSKAFLENNHHFMIAVASSGNRNWAQSFARSADVVADQYNVDSLLKFELSGTDRDIEDFILLSLFFTF